MNYLLSISVFAPNYESTEGFLYETKEECEDEIISHIQDAYQYELSEKPPSRRALEPLNDYRNRLCSRADVTILFHIKETGLHMDKPAQQTLNASSSERIGLVRIENDSYCIRTGHDFTQRFLALLSGHYGEKLGIEHIKIITSGIEQFTIEVHTPEGLMEALQLELVNEF